jgi:type IX secretion system PorP/SprF family membrane protein
MKRLLTLLFVFSVFVAYSQDIHYSQFYNAPLVMNPANTGIFNGDKRILLSYKDQWSSVPVPWKTFTGSYDMKFYPENSADYFFSGGLVFNYDRQGTSKISTSNINLLGSYTRVLNENNLFTIGVALGYSTRGFNSEDLTWDRQWNGVALDRGLSSGEVNLSADRVNFFENAIGANYRWQKSSRTNLDLGVSVFHFIEPKVAFFGGDDISLEKRVTLSGVGSFQVAESLDIQLHGLAQYQGGPSEYIVGGLGKFYLDNTPGSEWQLHAGASFRTKKAIVPTVALQHKNMYISASYDIGLSEFNQEHSGGGIELHFRYIWADPPSPKRVKVCPIF